MPAGKTGDDVSMQQSPPRDLPTIVLEAGGGSPGATWAFVEQHLASRGLVVRYDRAGYGRNAEWADDVGAAGVASRLETLLAREAVPGPYLLVGHSLGGLFVQYYAATHASDVAGLVLVDPTPSDPAFENQIRQAVPWSRRLAFPILGGSQRLVIRVIQALAWSGLFRVWNPLAGAMGRTGLPGEAANELIASLANPRHFGTLARELRALKVSQDLVATHPLAPDVPVMVVSAGAQPHKGKRPSPYFAVAARAMRQHHETMAARSASGRHIIMEQADHNSLLFDRVHATELAEQILRFAETCSRAPRATSRPASERA